MKKIILATLLSLSFCRFALAAPTASQELTGPEWVYKYLAKTFPEFNVSVGSASYEVVIPELICASSKIMESGYPIITTDCTTIDAGGNANTKSAADLFLALLSSGVEIDRTSEPGTTYISLRKVNCTFVEVQPTTPGDSIEAKYNCSIAAP